MTLGPVLPFELVRIARRRRFFVARFVFGLVLLGIIAIHFLRFIDTNGVWTHPFRPYVSIKELSALGQSLSISLIVAQMVLVLGLTPALVADAIASERQRKTLHDLLVTRLSSPMIVLGKAAARLANVGTLLALVLPIASLLTLFGGFSPESLLWGYGVILTTAYFLAGLSILTSVLCRRPRDAVGASYSLVGAWLFLPPILDLVVNLLPTSYLSAAQVVQAVINWTWPASPLSLITYARLILMQGPGVLRPWAAWLMGSQFVYGSLLLALASWQLRPAYRRQEGRSGRRSKVQAVRLRLLPRRPCGDDPVYWKEVHVANRRGGIVQQLGQLLVPVFLALVVCLALYMAYEGGVIKELWENGYFYHDDGTYRGREGFGTALRSITALVFGFWMLWLGRLTAALITTEREQDTWVSLLATPLDGDEIVQSKMLGAVRTTVPVGITVVVLWVIGLALGAIHPLGFLLALVGLVLFVSWATVLGTYFSLISKTTWRAQMWSQSILIAPHLLCCYLPLPSPLLMIGVAPLSYADVNNVIPELLRFKGPWWAACLGIAYVGLGIGVYVVATYKLLHAVYRRIDIEAGRTGRLIAREWVSPAKRDLPMIEPEP
jgi:ABC-type transport system involved in multi-copper enzyme maturation permease subunit